MLLRTKPFGVLSVFVVAGNILTIPLDAYAQITVDGSTATEVRGNVVSPTGAGTVSGGNLYNSFQEFNVPTSGVIFNTGSSTVDGSKINNIINRVTGDNPSAILGTIESRQAFPNANLFLLNPNGVVFSSNAKLDIGGSFNVSTGTGLGFDQNQKFIVDRNSLNFPSGDPKNIQFAVSQPAAIINQGNLSVAAGKDITITAGTVVNSGNLSAPNGNVSLAAVSGNSQVELRSPDLVLGLSVLKNAVPTNWNGTISALPKLAELLTGQVDQANQVVVRPDGSIALVASPNPSDIVVKDGMAIASGRIDVSSDSAKGGNVGIFGNQVGLVNSLINASGSTGGGNVLIGGDLQGKGIAPNALQTYVDGNSQILANGTLTGDGGKVIIWADRSTQFYGAIAARGGDISGNGGFVEVSGKDNLVYQGNTDTRAINGTTGILLLDPQNITIIAGANNPAELAANDQFADPGINNTINNGTINAATTNVILQATNDITFNAPISIASAGVGITAQAGNSIFVNSSITTNRGNVSLTANDNTASTATGLGNISIGSNIATNGGAINIKTSSSPGFGKSSIIINANSEINSNGGVIDIQGSGNGDSDGIDIRSTITSNGGAITIQGKSDGININVGSEINSNSGAILIKSDNSRIEVDGNISSTTGNVTLIANGRSLGLGISGNAKISTETGTITLNATGSNTIAPRDGLSISGANVAITSISGDINISGRVPNTAGGTGLIISDSTITTNGNINITGNTANPNELGIIISSPTNKLTINSGSGNLTFTSDRSIFPNVGFRGTGTLSLQPFSNNTSLVVNSSVSNTSPGTANVFADKSFFDALAASPSFSNRAIGSTTTSNPITLANPISLTSPLQLNSNNATITFASTINGTHDLTVNSGTGDVNFELTSTIGNTTSLGNITINSSGTTRFLSPVFNAASLTTDAGGRTFLYDNLTTTGLQTYNDAVSLFTPIQLNTTNGAIAFNNTINGSQNLTVNSGNGNIIFGGAIGNTTPLANLTANSLGITRFNSTVNAASLTTDTAGSTELNANITTTGTQTFNDAVNLTNAVQLNSTNSAIAFNNTINGSQNLTVNSGNGNIIFGGAIGNTTPLANLTANSLGITRFNSTVNAASLTTDTAGSTELNANITTTGTQTFNDAVNLTNAVQLNSTNSAIAFNTINGTQNLTVNSGTGNITFGGAIGNTTPLANLTANSSGITRFFSTVNAGLLSTDLGGSTELSANITTTGTQTFNDAVILRNDIQLNSTNSVIALTGTINGNTTGASKNLTVNSGTGNITFGGAIGDTTALGSITANSSGITRFNSTVNAASLTTDATGSTELNANITTTGTQTFNDAVNLTNAVQLNSTNSVIAFNTINGTQNLTVNSGTGNITFGGAVGNTTPLANLTANSEGVTRFNSPVNAALLTTDGVGTIELNANITTTGTQIYNEPVSLINAVQLNTTNSAIAFANTINGTQDLTVNSGTGDVNFELTSAIGNTTSLGNITINSSGTTRFLSPVFNATSLTTDVGGRTFLYDNLTTTGSQTYNDAVSLFTPIQLNATNGAIAFNNTINGSQNLTVNSGTGNITFGGTIGNTTPLANLTANSSGITRFNSTVNAASLTTDATGSTELNGNITTTGTQTFNDAVNLTNAIQLTTTNNPIFFNNSVNGTFGITLDTNGNSIFANAAIGNTTPLASLAIAPTTTLTTTDVINIISNGNISTGAISTSTGAPINARSVSLTSNAGSINVQGNIRTANLTGQAANVTLQANKNLTIASIDARGNGIQGGAVSLTSQTGSISTANITSSGKVGGAIFFNASTAINAGIINSSGNDKAGNVTLDPSGDVVVSSIDASSLTQGGNVKLVSTGGNLRITDSIVSSLVASCNGSSICTTGGTGGTISLQTGGRNPFIVGNSSPNGSLGILTTGTSTIALDTSIPVALGQTFIEGGISISPGTRLGGSSVTSSVTFTPLPKTCVGICGGNTGEQNNSNTGNVIDTSEIDKENAGEALSAGNFDRAFSLIEGAYISELQAFSGNRLRITEATITQAQDELQLLAERTGNTATLIYPILLRDRIEILVVPPKGVGKPFRQSSIARKAAVDALITEYRENLQDTKSNNYLDQSQDLYDLIIRPIDSQLTTMKTQTLVFVMDGGLRVMPASAFHDGKQFLIERYTIAHIPTFSAVRLEDRDRANTRVLAMGLTESVQGFSALPSVDTEIKTISSEILKGGAFLNNEFTVNNLQNQHQQGQYNIIHLGTHAQFVSSTSKDSFIQFWDSRLRLNEIPKLKFNSPVIDLLTLSACETAVGNNLGIAGLVVESGARSVLASLWQVSDAGTPPLMISFYKELPEALSKAQAIQQAQRNLLNGKVKIQGNRIVGIEGFPNIPLPVNLEEIDLRHPFYWSSFILVGNWL